MSDATAAFTRLPVLATAKQVYDYVFSHFWRILAWSLLPLILYFALTFVSEMISGDTDPTALLLGVIAGILSWLLISPIWAAVHRGVVLNENYSTGYLPMLASGYFWKFVLAQIYLGLSAAGIFSVLAIIYYGLVVVPLLAMREAPGLAMDGLGASGIFGIVVTLVLFVLALPYLMLRVSLMLPMQATGKGGWVKASWRMTRGNGFRMLLIALLVNLLPFFIVVLFMIAFILVGFGEGGVQSIEELGNLGVFGRLWAPGAAANYLYTIVVIVLIVIGSAFYTILSMGLNASALSFMFNALERGRGGD